MEFSSRVYDVEHSGKNEHEKRIYENIYVFKECSLVQNETIAITDDCHMEDDYEVCKYDGSLYDHELEDESTHICLIGNEKGYKSFFIAFVILESVQLVVYSVSFLIFIIFEIHPHCKRK